MNNYELTIHTITDMRGAQLDISDIIEGVPELKNDEQLTAAFKAFSARFKAIESSVEEAIIELLCKQEYKAFEKGLSTLSFPQQKNMRDM